MGPQAGIPIGAVQLGSGHMNSFRELLNSTLFEEGAARAGKGHSRRCFRGVEPFVGPPGRDPGAASRLLLIHVTPAVAMALDDGHPALCKFLEECGGVYLPGLRRSRTHKTAMRKNLAATKMPRYVRPPPKSTGPDAASGSDGAGDAAASSNDQTSPAGTVFTFSELFAGIGGFRLGLESVGGKCVFANELDPFAAAIYRAHFDGSECPLVEADILDLCAKMDMPADTDVLTAGFPCQPFSTRGTQRGFGDARGQLYRELVRVLHDARPKSFIFENVPGLVAMGREGGGPRRGQARGEAGPVFQTMLRAFEGCGYEVTWKLCNGRHYVAQHRERVFIVGLRKDLRRPAFSWEWYDKLLRGASKPEASPVLRDIMEPPDSAAVAECQVTPSQWARLREIHAKRDGLEGARLDIHAKAPTLISSYRCISNHASKYVFEERDGARREVPRFLTPREAARLQGFPEGFRAPSARRDGDVGVAHFYAGMGNAVVPGVVADIGAELVRCLRA